MVEDRSLGAGDEERGETRPACYPPRSCMENSCSGVATRIAAEVVLPSGILKLRWLRRLVDE